MPSVRLLYLSNEVTDVFKLKMPIMRARNKESRLLEQWGQNTSRRGLYQPSQGVKSLPISLALYNCSMLRFWRMRVIQVYWYFTTILLERSNLRDRKEWSHSLQPVSKTLALWLGNLGRYLMLFRIGKSGFIPLRGSSSWETSMWQTSGL